MSKQHNNTEDTALATQEASAAESTVPSASATMLPPAAVAEQQPMPEPTLPPITDADGAFAPDWFTRYDELQPYASTLSKFRSPAALAKSYANLERLRGYPATADSPRMAAFRQAVGLPETAQEFALTRPENTPDELWDDALAASMAQVAYEYGVPAPAMAALCEHYAHEGRLALQAAHVQQQKAQECAEAELRNDWGIRFDDNMQAIGNTLRMLGERTGVNVAALVDNPALRADADFARLMLAVSSLVDEAPMHAGTPLNGKDEAYRIAHDPAHPLHEAYMRTSHPRHKYANEQYDRLAFGKTL